MDATTCPCPDFSILTLLESTQIEQPAELPPVQSITAAAVSNCTVVEDGEEETIIPLTMAEIIAVLNEKTGNWPRRIGNALFVHDAAGVHWLDNSPALFGWLAARVGVVEWRRQIGCVTKEELFHELTRTATAYAALELLPHFPPRPDHYYACREYQPGDGEALSKLVGFFSPATAEDQQLILAMFATPFWGGKPGSRPAFLVTSDAGRGIGKSKITDILSILLGGHVELSASEEASRMRTRLLSAEGMKLRLARLDNVKTLKFSWAELESVITSPLISGHRLHKGEAGRPNNLMWVITLNGASLSTDMAQRVVMVKLVKPQRMGAWEADVVDHVEQNRGAIISDIRAFLEMEPEPVPDHSRWAAWEDEILGRLANPMEIKALIKERSGEADVESEEVELVEQYFAKCCRELEYSESTAVFLPSKIAATWFNEATGERRTTMGACRMISQFASEGKFPTIKPYRNTKQRGYIFCCDENSRTEPYFDIEERILISTTGKNRNGFSF